MWGPPDEIDAHPTGGTYERPLRKGGGQTTTYPFEDWRYRYLEGMGENVELEFVDPTSTGEYHLTMDASEKDALLYVPGAGGAARGIDDHLDVLGACCFGELVPCLEAVAGRVEVGGDEDGWGR